jgi:DNA-binding NarL/FixJ family response regulator
MTSSPTRVLIADDEALVRAGISLILSATSDFVVAAEAADGRQALRLAHDMGPDLCLLDVRMPHVDGVEVAAALAQRPTPPVVVMLTTFADDELLVAASRAGATGYLLKSMPPEQLVASLRAAMAGQVILAPSLVRDLVARTADRIDRSPDPRLSLLTPKEAEVLRRIAQGRSNEEIGRELYISEGTVKTHVASILRKLQVRDRVQAAVLAVGGGLGQGPRPEG